MPATPSIERAGRHGPVRWALMAHPAGIPAQALAQRWLGGELAAANPPLPRDRHGRPRLEAPDVDASWSHSGAHLLVALASAADVGADLEKLRPHPRALELARRFFHPAETDWLGAHGDGDRAEAFVRLWCAKEAVLKAHGRGIAFGLHRFHVGERDGALALLEADSALGAIGAWSLRECEPLPGYRAALAWRASAL